MLRRLTFVEDHRIFVVSIGPEATHAHESFYDRVAERKESMPKIVDNWKVAWRNRFFRDQLLLSLIGFLLASVLMRLFLSYIETRNGISLPDPLLPLFAPTDLKWITFSCIYSAMILGFVALAIYPFSLLLAIRSIFVMILLRITFLFLLPLDPPPGCIPLVDPFIRMPAIFPPTSRDLFFSWQTAVMALFGFCARWRDMRILFFSAAALVSILFLLQHVHYTIDLVAAPCFAYLAFGIAKGNTLHEVSGTPSNNRI